MARVTSCQTWVLRCGKLAAVQCRGRVAALDHHPIELDRDTFLKRTLAMELVELDELQQA
jgi:hypothetical protein